MASGGKFDEKALVELKPGDMMIMDAKTQHFASTKVPTVIQLHGKGPWAVTYVNPADDPCKK